MLSTIRATRKVGGDLIGVTTYQIIAAITGFGQFLLGAKGGTIIIIDFLKIIVLNKIGGKLIFQG
jgi:hypothetical protein